MLPISAVTMPMSEDHSCIPPPPPPPSSYPGSEANVGNGWEEGETYNDERVGVGTAEGTKVVSRPAARGTSWR